MRAAVPGGSRDAALRVRARSPRSARHAARRPPSRWNAQMVAFRPNRRRRIAQHRLRCPHRSETAAMRCSQLTPKRQGTISCQVEKTVVGGWLRPLPAVYRGSFRGGILLMRTGDSIAVPSFDRQRGVRRKSRLHGLGTVSSGEEAGILLRSPPHYPADLAVVRTNIEITPSSGIVKQIRRKSDGFPHLPTARPGVHGGETSFRHEVQRPAAIFLSSAPRRQHGNAVRAAWRAGLQRRGRAHQCELERCVSSRRGRHHRPRGGGGVYGSRGRGSQLTAR